jgi:hypothetical protein
MLGAISDCNKYESMLRKVERGGRMTLGMRVLELLTATLIFVSIATPSHAAGRAVINSKLLGCWSQDQSGVVHNPNEEFTTFTICFERDNQLSEYWSNAGPILPEAGNKRMLEGGDGSLEWSASQDKLRFVPIRRSFSLEKFSCDFSLSRNSSHEKLILRNCAPDNAWAGTWIFNHKFSQETKRKR